MTAEEFSAAHARIGLSSTKLGLALGYGKHGGRTIRRYKSGARKVPGPVALAMLEMLRNAASLRKVQDVMYNVVENAINSRGPETSEQFMARMKGESE